VTLALSYEHRIVGDVAGLFMVLDYPAGSSVPGTGTDARVKERIATVAEGKVRVLGDDQDTDADGQEDRLRLLVALTEGTTLPTGPIARVRFDCVDEARLAADQFRCTVDQVSDGAGQLIAAEEARKVTCMASIGQAGK